MHRQSVVGEILCPVVLQTQGWEQIETNTWIKIEHSNEKGRYHRQTRNPWNLIIPHTRPQLEHQGRWRKRLLFSWNIKNVKDCTKDAEIWSNRSVNEWMCVCVCVAFKAIRNTERLQRPCNGRDSFNRNFQLGKDYYVVHVRVLFKLYYRSGGLL